MHLTVQPQKQAMSLKFPKRKYKDGIISVVQISCAIIVQLICNFIFEGAKSRFSFHVAQVRRYSVIVKDRVIKKK